MSLAWNKLADRIASLEKQLSATDQRIAELEFECHRVPVTLLLPLDVARRLEVLSTEGNDVEEVIWRLIDHAQQGVYRPGSWERPWIERCFPSDDWEDRVEADPTHPMFVRPSGLGPGQRPSEYYDRPEV